MLDAHDACRARRMNELVAADRNPHVRRAGRDGAEEDEVARRETIGGDRRSGLKLLADVTRQRDAMLREHVPREAAAIETIWIGTRVLVRRAPERQRRASEGVHFGR